jgi:hypothetical protein
VSLRWSGMGHAMMANATPIPAAGPVFLPFCQTKRSELPSHGCRALPPQRHDCSA